MKVAPSPEQTEGIADEPLALPWNADLAARFGPRVDRPCPSTICHR